MVPTERVVEDAPARIKRRRQTDGSQPGGGTIAVASKLQGQPEKQARCGELRRRDKGLHGRDADAADNVYAQSVGGKAPSGIGGDSGRRERLEDRPGDDRRQSEGRQSDYAKRN